MTEKEEPKNEEQYKTCLEETMELKLFGDNECLNCPYLDKCKKELGKVAC